MRDSDRGARRVRVGEDEGAMRSMWKGAVAFGLVSIPVKMYSATEERDVSFHQVRRSDGSRVRYRRVAEADGAEVPYNEIAKGYTLDSGETVVLTDEDFADLPLPTAHSLDVLQFVPLEQVDPIYFTKSYYLEPDKAAAKPYVLLREALARSGMVAVVKVAIRTREQLATLRVRDDVIVLETMLWPDEVRTPDFAFLDEDITLREPELAMADALVASMGGNFAPEEYTDGYRDALMQVIEAKVAGREVTEPEETSSASTGNVVDLMAALRASVDAAKARRGQAAADSAGADQDAGDDAQSPSRAAVKKSAAKKSTGPRSTGTAEATVTKAAATKAAATKAAATKAAATKAASTKDTAAGDTASKVAAKKAAAKKTPAKKAAGTAASTTTAKKTAAARPDAVTAARRSA